MQPLGISSLLQGIEQGKEGNQDKLVWTGTKEQAGEQKAKETEIEWPEKSNGSESLSNLPRITQESVADRMRT